MASTCTCNCKFPLLLLLLLLFVLIIAFCSESCYGQRTFGFDVHHRFSDSIRQVFPIDHLPEKGSFDYYRALAHRDRFFHGRRLANTSNDDQILTFADGNTTYLVTSLGFLHYASVSLGTPGVSFFVALDTGSDLFWVPCNCSSCAHSLRSSNGDVNLNIYSPSASFTSKNVPCNSSLCEQKYECHINQSTCPYEVLYLSADTSTSGYLVEDVLHLTTDYSQPESVDPHVTFGCGQVEAGSFLDGAAPNGLFGLGMDKVSVPSILSSADLTANSFSMCFGSDGIGRINFGDKGSPDQAETTFNVNQPHPTYNISVTQITVGTNLMNVNFTAIFDTGTSFTYLNDPVYTHLTKSFNAQIQDKRRPFDSSNPFDYCYDPSSTSSNLTIPALNLTMGGGGQFHVYDPIVVFGSGNTISFYCLAVVKSSGVNIIGQNFMTGYLIVFDREKSVLGWTESDCYAVNGSSTTNTQPKTTTSPPPKSPRNSTAMPPASAAGPGSVSPESAKRSGNDSLSSGAPSASVQWSQSLNLCNCRSLILFLVFFTII
ncbi:aspartyl protease family protein 1-like isoform X1 [Telopea speciosissima]|uniref:aspartyl protease family protein 1-like isoform X1 n=1 Tax=Telopea speciosissima TaxID=54955 RepID=UPI001CC710D3|nr:aspartyl protease family protein 1-like isoform X1 [Telopea speciosissima]